MSSMLNVEDTNCTVKLYYYNYEPHVVFSDVTGKAHTRKCKIIDREYKLCEFTFMNQKIQRRFH